MTTMTASHPAGATAPGTLGVHTLPGNRRLSLVQGDLTEQKVDAIVNPANKHLSHGAGVAGAIVRRGGPEIQMESDAWVREHGLVEHAHPALTGAGRLPCRYVIHAVGPMWGEGDEEDKLEAAVGGSLDLAAEHQLASLALPALSTGIFGFPKDRAARLILQAVLDHFESQPQSSLGDVRIVVFDRQTIEAFETEWARRWPESIRRE
jgi:O-acetyl-ADP-ribose deacetylase (regulator of RNase III)